MSGGFKQARKSNKQTNSCSYEVGSSEIAQTGSKDFGWKSIEEFWDCYQSSVYENELLRDVDKFSYLKSMVQQTVKTTISGNKTHIRKLTC